MKRLSVLVSVLVITLLVISLVISCAPKSKEAVILRLTMAQPSGDPLTLNHEEMAKRFNERADGEYIIKVYPAETLIKLMESLDSVRTGAVEIASVPWPVFAGIDMRFGELPFVYNNISASAAAAQEPELYELHNEIFEDKFNQHVLAIIAVDIPQLISEKPVRTLEDWEGLLIAAPSPVAADMITHLGGAPVTVPWPEYYSALEKGVADGALAGTTHMQTAGLTDVASYVTIFNPYGVFEGYTINLDVWNEMPERIQDILLEETGWSAQTLNESFIITFEEDKESLAALGMDVYIVPAAERDRWKAVVQPYLDELLSGMGEFGQKIKQIADKANAEYP